MLNKHLLDDDSVLFNFEFMAWLIRGFGTPHAPAAPSPLHRTSCLSERAWAHEDQRPVYVWAEDELAHIKSQCHMEEWNIMTRPFEDRPLPYEEHCAIVAYDPQRCSERGYFTACVLNRISEILIDSRLDTKNLAEDVCQKLKILTVCYLGQGFTMISLTADYLADFVPHKKFDRHLSKQVINRTLFGTALVLTCRRFPVSALASTYGSTLNKRPYKKLWNAFKHLEEYKTEVETLQMLCGKGDNRPVASRDLAAAV